MSMAQKVRTILKMEELIEAEPPIACNLAGLDVTWCGNCKARHTRAAGRLGRADPSWQSVSICALV